MAGTFGVAHLGERRLAGTSSMRPAEVPAKRRRSPKRSTPLPRLNPGPVMPIFPFAPVGNTEIVFLPNFRTRGLGLPVRAGVSDSGLRLEEALPPHK